MNNKIKPALVICCLIAGIVAWRPFIAAAEPLWKEGASADAATEAIAGSEQLSKDDLW